MVEIKSTYLDKIINLSEQYLLEIFSKEKYSEFINEVYKLNTIDERKKIIKEFTNLYLKFVKKDYQNKYKETNGKLVNFINKKDSGIKIIWGDCLNVLKGMKSESIHVMVTSPPYYNAREYSNWENLNDYLNDMREIINECYRVLENSF